ncbi:5-oxoprolinase subunit PxpA [Isoptericola sp. AK164]|uniref:LamB/YcsF family protein n=1 Tax=Isoptericola sp. AK164 TaxID=3024246 RepID=UPI0024185F8B|nr:5-oxoprolinase subunit PxpA [Isoptericola sp. AK164]
MRTSDATAPRSIDLNSDLGEGTDPAEHAGDARMLEIVSSANVACAFHAGDPATIHRTVHAAVRRGVSVGAHVAYNDREGFGRRDLAVPSDELRADLVYQLGAIREIARTAGTSVRYVKPHGALYNTAAVDPQVAEDVAAAIVTVDPELVLLGLPGSVALDAARAAGLVTASEAFADRAYTAEGRLVPRGVEGAVLHDPEEVAARMLRLVHEGVVRSIEGTDVQVVADSICVHGDTLGAAAMAARLREVLTGAGVSLRPFVTP